MSNEKNIVAGILAHVDAGKTTLSEAMLYLSGKIKKLGRVDHRDCYLDNHSIERQRGITIFSKMALMDAGNTHISLLDTPGHMDFSAEAERSLQVLDYAVLVISGTDGVQAHTETLWRLLRRYNVPCFIFITKMDLPGCDRAAIMSDLQRHLSENCLELSGSPDTQERLAMCSEEAMEKYLADGRLSDSDIAALISGRALFPCFFGSGLKTDGVEDFLEALDRYTLQPSPLPGFAARVFKIARDPQGNRLSYIKLTGGELKTREAVKYTDEKGQAQEEKVTQLRLYSGIKYDSADTVRPGQVCAVLGLSHSYAGQGLGLEPDFAGALLEPVLSYRIKLPPDADARLLLPKLQQLQEEDPMLRIVWNEHLQAICVRLMGRVQTEVLKSLVKERFDTDIELDEGQIMYKETIADKVEGVGHFEPLRHYAEVHLIMEPLPEGSGIVLDTVCPEDELDRNWQRLILTHLQEREFPGVLTGSPITDIKISLAAGKAHVKHTEGGDFRQATYRAVRQGLMKAKSVLLEPWYSFSLEVQPEQLGRAINDIRAMNGSFTSPEDSGDMLRIEGSAPAAAMDGYLSEVMAYTKGRGHFSCRLCGYRPCKNAQAVIEETGYDAESDTENPADSVFCAHGGGFNVKWDRVEEYMHLESCLKPQKAPAAAPAPVYRHSLDLDERALEEIMEREFGPIRRPEYRQAQVNAAPAPAQASAGRKDYIIVDGYNVIYAWDELKALARDNMDLARTRLMDMLSSYCGFTKKELVLVFDAYRSPGKPGGREEYHNIHVAYTAEGETADAYIERIARDIGKNYSVRVISSDSLIQLSAMGSGVLRCSSAEFGAELEGVFKRIEELMRSTNYGAHMTKLKDGKQGI